MAFLNQSYDVADLPKAQQTSFDVLPDGWYSATITGAEIKETKAGTGEYVAIKYSITGPTHQGRVVFGNLNLKNPNQKAEEIAREQLGQILMSIGVPKITDTDQLIGGNLSIKLSTRKSEQYGDSNDIKGFKAVAGSASTMPKPAMPQTGAKSSAAPWAKR
jgi:hypothetical protein